ncbi:MAG: ABC transporter permease [Clostridia bacterium]|nr:ABC transporter permease [Clostridia bacterium]
MWRYALKRLLWMIPVILGIALFVFVIIDMAPGDPVYQIVGERATQEQVEAAREEYGLNDNIFIRFGRYIINLCKGDLGKSYITKEDVFHAYLSRLPATLSLAAASIVVALAIAIPLGIYAATHQNTWKDSFSMVAALVGVSMPNFWLGLLLILLFALKLGWFPSGGMRGFTSIILPALTEGAYLAGLLTRTTRSSMLETIRADYMTTAMAKGVAPKDAVMKHAFRNSLIPIVTIAGIQFAYVMGGVVMTESVFAWPGVGLAIVTAINDRDTPMITGFIILTALVVCIVNLLLDIAYAFIDPRIKAQYSGKK